MNNNNIIDLSEIMNLKYLINLDISCNKLSK